MPPPEIILFNEEHEERSDNLINFQKIKDYQKSNILQLRERGIDGRPVAEDLGGPIRLMYEIINALDKLEAIIPPEMVRKDIIAFEFKPFAHGYLYYEDCEEQALENLEKSNRSYLSGIEAAYQEGLAACKDKYEQDLTHLQSPQISDSIAKDDACIADGALIEASYHNRQKLTKDRDREISTLDSDYKNKIQENANNHNESIEKIKKEYAAKKSHAVRGKGENTDACIISKHIFTTLKDHLDARLLVLSNAKKQITGDSQQITAKIARLNYIKTKFTLINFRNSLAEYISNMRKSKLAHSMPTSTPAIMPISTPAVSLPLIKKEEILKIIDNYIALPTSNAYGKARAQQLRRAIDGATTDFPNLLAKFIKTGRTSEESTCCGFFNFRGPSRMSKHSLRGMLLDGTLNYFNAEQQNSSAQLIEVKNILAVIDAYIATKSEYSHGYGRAQNLRCNINFCSTIKDLKDTLADFLVSGKTSYDNEEWPFSGASGKGKDSLRGTIFEACFPHGSTFAACINGKSSEAIANGMVALNKPICTSLQRTAMINHLLNQDITAISNKIEQVACKY